ncbi:MAG: SHOCT domain-containing protein [Thermoplasmata archaeon]
MSAVLPPSYGAQRSEPTACGPVAHPGGWPWFLLPLVVVVVVVAVVATLALVAWFGGGPTVGPWASGYPAFWPIFPLGLFLLLFVGFVTLRFALGGSTWGGRWGWPLTWDAHEILRERFARGEITSDELRQMRKALDETR